MLVSLIGTQTLACGMNEASTLCDAEMFCNQ